MGWRRPDWRRGKGKNEVYGVVFRESRSALSCGFGFADLRQEECGKMVGRFFWGGFFGAEEEGTVGG